MAATTTREPLVTSAEVAEYLGVAYQTLMNWRSQGKGPDFRKIGNRVRYRMSDVDAWLEDQQQTA